MNTEEKERKNSDTNIIKQKLYFDNIGKIFIEFNLDQKTTCQKIFDDNKTQIKDIIKSINNSLPEDFDIDSELEEDNYFFCIVYPNKNKELISSKINLKLRLGDKVYNILTNNSNPILCFLSKNKSKINLRKNARSLFVLEKDIYEDTQNSNLQDNTIKGNNIDEKLYKKYIYIFDEKNKNFIKKDITIDFEKITLIKENIFIYINQIKKMKNFLYDSEEYKKYKIKGDKMYGYIIIDTTNAQNEEQNDNNKDKDKDNDALDKNKSYYLFAQKKNDLYYKLLNAIKVCINNHKILMTDIKIENNIYSSKSSLFALYHLIIDNCFLIKEILSNDEKRKIFMEIYPEKKIGEIIDKIIEYKSLNKKGQYLESWTNFKQILTYIEPYQGIKDIKNEKKEKDGKGGDNLNNIKIEELLKIIQKVNINKYKEVLNQTNDALQKAMNNAKKDAQNSFNLQNNLNQALKELLKDNLFDDLFFYLYNIFIIPFFENINKKLKEGESPQNKSIIRKKFQLLLAIYYYKFFEPKFNYIGDKDDIRTASMVFHKLFFY